jgi:hypothetical protein
MIFQLRRMRTMNSTSWIGRRVVLLAATMADD